jgi:hypothetical protein
MRRKLLFRIGYVLFIVLLGAIAIPNFIGARTTPAQNACVNNLRWLDGAKQQWQLEHNKSTNDTPTFEDLLPYFGSSRISLSCPQGGTYVFGRVGEPSRCSLGGTHALP